MQVKKAGGKVYGAVLTAAEKKAMDLEIQRELAEYDRIKELVSRYEMEDQDDIWLCTQMLKRIGVDVEAWHKESEHGT